MPLYQKVLFICVLLFSLFATIYITSIFWNSPETESSENIIRRHYQNEETKEENNSRKMNIEEDMSGDILLNQTSWVDYGENWSGDILVRRDPGNNQLIFTDEYRYAMTSKGLHPLNIEHKYLHERYLTMNKYCDALTETNNQYHSKGSYYRARVSDNAKLLQCALLKVASSTWFLLLIQLEGLKLESYPYPTLWPKLSLSFGINNPELTAMRYQTYTKFMIARHPFSRLFSAYKDKFVETTAYGDRIADKIIHINYFSNMSKELVVQMRQELKRGGNNLTNGLSDNIIKQLRRLSALKGNFKITFLEFLNFIVSQKDPNGFQMNDDHFNTANIVCNPCAIRYDIIAKYETLQNDSDLILDYVKNHHDHKVFFPKPKSIKSPDSCNNAFKDIPLTVRRSLYETFKEDFLLFGYEYREEVDNFC